jgi:hypothetical protein
MKLSGKILLFAFLALSVGAVSEDKPWTEIHSPHFQLITNGGEGAGRRAVRQFELIRAVFASQFPGLTLDGSAPLLIVATRDRHITSGFDLPANIGGRYMRLGPKEYAIIRLDIIGNDRIDPDTYATVYHEYVHSLLHRNFKVLPNWLDEGMAQFYGFTRFEGERMYIGAPPRNIHWMEALFRRTNPPIGEFIATRSMYFPKNDQDSQLYYAQAWALTHFLMFGPGMELGTKLKKFVNALQRGDEQKKAFEDAFGPIAGVQKQYDLYLQRVAFPAGVVPTPGNLSEKDFSARDMSLEETQSLLSDLSHVTSVLVGLEQKHQ